MIGLTLLLIEMGISRVSKTEPKLEISNTILDIKVEGCLARTSGPDMDYLSQTAEEEGLFRQVEIGHLGLINLGFGWFNGQGNRQPFLSELIFTFKMLDIKLQKVAAAVTS